jgi:hypothetical protein
MEGKQDAAIATATDDKNKALDHGAAKKKKRGAINLIRVALFMLRRRSGGNAKPLEVEVASKGMWKKLVGSMRPLHLQHNQSPPPSIMAVPEKTVEHFEDVFPQPVSTRGQYSPSSSFGDSNSRYASAVNLQELDESSEDDDDDDVADDGGDMMIDAKAEEFIAQFYEQMRLQRVDSFNRYNEMIARGMH